MPVDPACTYDHDVRVGLVGCVKTKLDREAQAASLYVSPLFGGRRRYVEATCDRWFILSAKHGLLSPVEVVAPYDETLKTVSADARRRWAKRVLATIDEVIADCANVVFEIHAGAEYRDFGLVVGLRDRGARVEVPTEGLRQGEQLAFYATPHMNRARETREKSTRSAGRRAYAPLQYRLEGEREPVVRYYFTDVERILGRALPMSARRYRAWWANDAGGTHSHAAAWIDAGWRVDAVDLAAGTVRFTRTRS